MRFRALGLVAQTARDNEERMITLLLALALAPTPEHHLVMVSIDGFAAYSLKDPTVAVPNIRRLIAEGAVAEGMTPVNPTVTWPNHTSMVTAGASPGTHGYLSTEPDMAAIFVASGRGIKKGSRLGMIRNVDVAPTAARLLGLALEGVDGRVLAEILQ